MTGCTGDLTAARCGGAQKLAHPRYRHIFQQRARLEAVKTHAVKCGVAAAAAAAVDAAVAASTFAVADAAAMPRTKSPARSARTARRSARAAKRPATPLPPPPTAQSSARRPSRPLRAPSPPHRRPHRACARRRHVPPQLELRSKPEYGIRRNADFSALQRLVILAAPNLAVPATATHPLALRGRVRPLDDRRGRWSLADRRWVWWHVSFHACSTAANPLLYECVYVKFLAP